MIASARFDVRFKIFADFDLNQRLFKAKFPFLALNRTIASVQLGGVTSGGVDWRGPIFEMLEITRKNYGILWSTWPTFWVDIGSCVNVFSGGIGSCGTMDLVL